MLNLNTPMTDPMNIGYRFKAAKLKDVSSMAMYIPVLPILEKCTYLRLCDIDWGRSLLHKLPRPSVTRMSKGIHETHHHGVLSAAGLYLFARA
jgi:hypothetical protein